MKLTIQREIISFIAGALIGIILFCHFNTSLVIELMEQGHTFFNFNYFKKNKYKILDIAKNKNFSQYKSDDDISIVYVCDVPRIAYIYQLKNVFFEREELLLITFEDGYCVELRKKTFPDYLRWEFLHYVVEFSDQTSRIKNERLSKIEPVIEDANARLVYYQYFRQNFTELMVSLGYDVVASHVSNSNTAK